MSQIGDYTGIAVALPVGWSAYERFPFQLGPVSSPESIKLRLLKSRKVNVKLGVSS